MRVERLAARPDLAPAIGPLSKSSWPEFMLHGDNPHWMSLFDALADHQLLFLQGESLVAVAHTAPGRWTGRAGDLPRTVEEIIVRALEDRAQGAAPDAHFALAAMVAPDRRGGGLSHRVLAAMVEHAAQHGARALLAPVRPTWKTRYPLTPMERYVRWTRPDGAPFDPWLRVHWRRGGEILAVAPATITVTGTLAEWRRWTDMEFPESGRYVVPGALSPIEVDVEADIARYEDPNVWVRHEARGGSR